MQLEKYYEDPSVLHIGTREHRGYFIPFSEESGSTIENRNSMNRNISSHFFSLSGDWKFRYYENPSKVEEFINHPDLWKQFDNITVPSCWQMLGYDRHQYVNTRYPFPCDPPFVPAENPCGAYIKRFNLKKKEGRQFLNFEGVDSCFYVWMNGTFVGYSEVSHSTSEFEVTEQMVEGENVLAVLVLKWCSGSYMEDQDKFRMSGIFRDVYLLLRPDNHIRDFFVHTSIEEDGTTGQIAVDIQMEGETAVKCALFEPDGNIIDNITVQNNRAEFRIENAKLWTAETPTLYRISMYTGEETIQARVGIRTIKVKNQAILINGKPIEFKGVNRHDSNPKTGCTISFDQAITDLRLMKEHNINAIRTSHYPNAPWFVDLCNKYGFYVIAEADVETHGAGDILDRRSGWHDNIGLLAQNKQFEEAIIDRVKMNVMRDKNACSVIIWSMGNESGYGPSFEKAGRWMKEYDPSRLTHYEGSVHVTNDYPNDTSMLDVYSKMYDSPEEAMKYLDNPENKKPYILCEYIHAMGNGPGDIEEYRTLIDKYPGFCGGFVWEWCDHAVDMGKTIEGKTRYFYGGDFLETPHDGNFCVDGLVSPDRKAGTGLLEYKNVIRPARAFLSEDGASIQIENKLDFLEINDILYATITLLVDGEKKEVQTLNLPVIKPHERKEVAIPFALPADGEVSVLIQYYQSEPLPLTEAGHRMGFDQILISERKPVTLTFGTQTISDSNLSVKEKEDKIIIESKEFRYVFDKYTGVFRSLVYGQMEMLKTPMNWNIWRAPTDNDRNIRKEWEEAGYNRSHVKVYSTEVKKEKDTVEILCKCSMLAVSLQRSLSIDAKFIIHESGEILVQAEGVRDTEFPYLPRFGLRFFLPQEFNQLSYYGYGPTGSYLDMHQATYLAKFNSNVDAEYCDHIKPQEHGSHMGCRMVKLDSEDASVLVEGKNDFSFQASAYTQEELSQKKHNFELVKADATVLCIDYKQSGIGSNSCGPELAEKYQLKEENISFEIKLQFARKE